MKSDAKSVKEYINSLPEDRADVVKKVRKLILDNLPEGYEEGMNWGMIVYEVPLKRYPDTYNGQPLGYVALASQKNYLSLYLMHVYVDKEVEKWFTDEYRKSGKKANMGKSCVRFKKFEDLPTDLIAKVVSMTSVDECIAAYSKNKGKSLRHQQI